MVLDLAGIESHLMYYALRPILVSSIMAKMFKEIEIISCSEIEKTRKLYYEA